MVIANQRLGQTLEWKMIDCDRQRCGTGTVKVTVSVKVGVKVGDQRSGRDD